MHTITLDDVILSMEMEILIASSGNAKTGKVKDLKYCPANLEYRFRFYDRSSKVEIKSTSKDPLKAIEKYNSYAP